MFLIELINWNFSLSAQHSANIFRCFYSNKFQFQTQNPRQWNVNWARFCIRRITSYYLKTQEKTSKLCRSWFGKNIKTWWEINKNLSRLINRHFWCRWEMRQWGGDVVNSKLTSDTLNILTGLAWDWEGFCWFGSIIPPDTNVVEMVFKFCLKQDDLRFFKAFFTFSMHFTTYGFIFYGPSSVKNDANEWKYIFSQWKRKIFSPI